MQSTTRLPVLRYGEEVISEPDEIVQYIDRLFHYPPMSYDNKDAARACRDVFQKFSFYVKDVSHSKEQLVAELRRLDNYLVESNHRLVLI